MRGGRLFFGGGEWEKSEVYGAKLMTFQQARRFWRTYVLDWRNSVRYRYRCLGCFVIDVRNKLGKLSLTINAFEEFPKTYQPIRTRLPSSPFPNAFTPFPPPITSHQYPLSLNSPSVHSHSSPASFTSLLILLSPPSFATGV